MVFLDVAEYWTVHRPVRLLLEGLFDDEQERLLHFVTSASDAVQAVMKFTPPESARHFPLLGD
jgi:predicted Rossmann-fold nucleotide-binding protein